MKISSYVLVIYYTNSLVLSISHHFSLNPTLCTLQRMSIFGKVKKDS